jgi:hypothetical protein
MAIEKADLLVKILSLIVLSIGAYKGYLEYKKAQMWKKVDFFFSEYKKFIDDPYVTKTLIMLDGYKVLLPVAKNELDGENDYLDFKPSNLAKALENVGKEIDRPRDEVYIRLCVDKFLLKIGLFERYLDSQIVDEKQIKSYFGYYFQIMGDPEDSTIEPDTKKVLYKFMRQYNYAGAITLLEKAGYKIPPDKFS